MSRCNGCGNTFDETTAWEEYCCLECAKRSFVGKPRGKADESKKWYRARLAEFKKNLEDPKFARLIRMNGEQAKPATFGKFAKRVYRIKHFDGSVETVTRVENVGSEISVRPITAEERALAIKRRGRESFSDCCRGTGMKSAGMGNLSNR